MHSVERLNDAMKQLTTKLDAVQMQQYKEKQTAEN